MLGTAQEATDRKQAAQQSRRQAEQVQHRDIFRVPQNTHYQLVDFGAINWERRLACQADPVLDLTTYHPNVFKYGFADYHRELIADLEELMKHGGREPFACPRQGGKTAISRHMIIRALKYGIREFVYYIGSTNKSALDGLKAIITQLYASKLLRQDFPEICYPIYRVDGSGGAGARSQTYMHASTHLLISKEEMALPCMLLTAEDASFYEKHAPEFLERVVEIDTPNDEPRWITKSAGAMVRVAGIDGSVRGEAGMHPIRLTQPRPDLILLDDVQKDGKADSPTSCDKLEQLVEKAIEYLAAGDTAPAIMWPGTVIRDGDGFHRYLDPQRKPEWRSKVVSFITKYPKGISNESIDDEVKQGKLWLEYMDIRKASLIKYKDNRLGTEFYKKNRLQLEDGFVVSWEDHYTRSSNPHECEQSAIQHAMNARFKDYFSFRSELQNKPAVNISESERLLPKRDELIERTTSIPPMELQKDWDIITCMVDVQGECLFYKFLACDHNFSGQFVDWGIFPNADFGINVPPRIEKKQLNVTSYLSRLYFDKYPEQKTGEAYRKVKGRKWLRAPLEESIYYALSVAIPWLMSREFQTRDQFGSTKTCLRLAIDASWGMVTDTIIKFIRDFNDPRVMAYFGLYVSPGSKQYEEYHPQDGWLFQTAIDKKVKQRHPNDEHCMWIAKAMEGYGKFSVDVDRAKTFLMQRLSCPVGTTGAITFPKMTEADAPRLLMAAEHICDSEYPDPDTRTGYTKDKWKPRESGGAGRRDNDLLDCAAGTMALASFCGASIKPREKTSVSARSVQKPPKQKLSDIRKRKRA